MTKRHTVLRRLLVLAVAGLITSIVIGAQGPTPDLLSLQVGMPQNVARTALQKRMPGSIFAITPTGFTLSDPMNRDMVSVYVTAEPNDPAVWMIQRSQGFTEQNSMSQKALMTALREKYGKETLTNDRGGGGLYVYWIYDQNGKLLSSADMGLTGCKGINFINYVRIGPPRQPNTLEQSCFQSFFAVTAMLNRSGPELLGAYTVELVNLPYALKAATATGNANNAAADQGRRNQIEKGDQNKPKF